MTPSDILKVFSELTPLRIALDREQPDRTLWLERPTKVEIVDERAVRLVTSARIQWDVVNIKLPITLRSISVLATPSIETHDGRDVLMFAMKVEEADLSVVPSFIESQIIARVNEELEAHRTEIAWRFAETLDFKFRMPEGSEPRRDVHLYARHGNVRVSNEGLVLATSFELDAEPHGELSDEPEMRAPSSASPSDSLARNAA
ncbi:MAG TPA: hypothetical protein VHM19_19080 [Polyangiales bacterium]|jgi:hypothetical protein|nr:hypothetical protein [Polyangiales bacterium]